MKPPSTAHFLVLFAVSAVAGGAVFLHADRHGIRHPTRWASAVFLFLPLALLAYVVYISRTRRRSRGGG